ncbi:MAG: DEAD/DEAH box helicase, partial [Planctomycetaceae bacterium]|nr:DEAD/DEAH box helicase [Planctomycetaceae bacterium]
MVDLLSTGQEPEKTTFKELGLHENTLKTLENIGYEKPSPIQAGFIPIAVTGSDCTGQARTGTGKTAAFILPTLERIDLDEKAPTQAIVLAPTRELSEQVAVEAKRLAGGHTCRVAVLVGGRPINKQMDALRKGVQIAVGTPGRVIDLLNRRALDLSQVKVAILDEADRMLDIGFRPDIEKILRRCPTERQTLLLSATMPTQVERLAKKYMRDPQRVDLSEGDIVVDTVDQYYATVDNDRKFGMLVKILAKERPQQALVFMRTKRGVERLYQRLVKKLPGIAMMNGDMHQSKRDRVMREFREGKVRMLIATDVVGRGIDVSGISHIINYDIPEYHDDYVHRVGRTGRLSSAEKGVAITFVMRDQGEQLTNIEKRINRMLPEYKVDDFKAYQPRAPRPTVE